MLSILLIGCGSSGAKHDSGVPQDIDASVNPPIDGGSLAIPTEGWIDVHTHCSVPENGTCADLSTCCEIGAWQSAHDSLGAAAAVLLSTEHVAILSELGEPAGPLDPALLYEINEVVEGATKRDATLLLFPSLECWHDTLIADGEQAWIDACKADVDRWVAAGAYGFKDHIGKQFDDNGNFDGGRWLGTWNRLNGFCAPGNVVDPNRACMTESAVRYPAIESAWREVIQYIVEEKQLVVLSHATSFPGPEQCYDPLSNTTGSCGDVTRVHVLELAAWAKSALSVAARRRIVIAHIGFMSGAPLMQLLDTGVSVDLASPIATIGQLGCAGRAGLALYPKQFLFGTDRKIGPVCSVQTWAAWIHALSGNVGDVRNFDTCFGTLPIEGMALGQTVVAGCEFSVPEGLLKDISGDNFRNLYQ